MDALYFVLLIALLAVLVGGLLTLRTQQAALDSVRLRQADEALRKAALPFVIRASAALGILGAALFLLFAFLPGLSLRLGFSAAAGVLVALAAAHLSMHAGIRAASVTSIAATRSQSRAVRKALAGGAVGGFAAAGATSFALGALVLIYTQRAEAVILGEMLLQNLVGFVLGACAVAVAFRCGGGIAAQSINLSQQASPDAERPDNPARMSARALECVAGLGGAAAEYCALLSAALAAAMILGTVAEKSMLGVSLPMVIAAAGIAASVLAAYWAFRSPSPKPLSTLQAGQLVATMLMLLFSLAAVILFRAPIGLFFAALFGAAAGAAVGLVDDYYANPALRPAKLVAGSLASDFRGGFLDALWNGSRAMLVPAAITAMAAVAAFAANGGLKEPAKGMFGLALAALGALAAGAYRTASASSACIIKQAASIAPSAGLEVEPASLLTGLCRQLPSAGIPRGHTAVSAALAGLGLYAAFVHSANLPTSDLNQPLVLAGLLAGAALVCWSAGRSVQAARKAAPALEAELRRQYAEIPGLAEGKAEGNHERCSEIAAAHALRSLALPCALLIGLVVLLGAAFQALKDWLYAGTRSAGGGELAAGMIAGAILLALIIGLAASGFSATIGSARSAEAGPAADGQREVLSLGAAIGGAAAPMLALAPILLAAAALAFAGWLR